MTGRYALLAATLLTLALLALHDGGSELALAIGSDRKGKVSLAIYLAALPLAFIVPWASVALFVTVAVVWFVPDRRVERVLAS